MINTRGPVESQKKKEKLQGHLYYMYIFSSRTVDNITSINRMTWNFVSISLI